MNVYLQANQQSQAIKYEVFVFVKTKTNTMKEPPKAWQGFVNKNKHNHFYLKFVNDKTCAREAWMCANTSNDLVNFDDSMHLFMVMQMIKTIHFPETYNDLTHELQYTGSLHLVEMSGV